MKNRKKFLRQDGGSKSTVWGYYFIEWKKLFSIVLLHFHPGTRDAFHSHAFHAVSFVLRGKLREVRIDETGRVISTKIFTPSLKPKFTLRSNCHRVESIGHSWVLSFRGPWAETWVDFYPSIRKFFTLTHGRITVGEREVPRAPGIAK